MNEPTYVAINPACGHAVACIVDQLGREVETAKIVAGWKGYRVERTDAQQIRDGAFTWCPVDCQHRPRGRHRPRVKERGR